ncbi:FAD-dependent oxidoreductase [Phycisphaera mikurensis]|uniref:Putative oxidoreductase n=1 Tax=Phycisphaera mikurensis (strain NBRC 102666 / KCTC 22515 / FYK2301M01) TaxID=1142394 RepID=I0II14_PHYMF|nr:FAD-dependent oxidoreductase [Phycisphaera mikurensis]MBB6442534.1 thioredoxin reductase (NADPH) [Phycisphaera mikurensis]BAM04902.1 putative oxidoreductase [Phycisphaera mikurensis NBRC 102666]
MSASPRPARHAPHGSATATLEGNERFAFPQLSEDQIQRAAAFGERERHGEGVLVFERGQRSVDFYVLVSGCIEIFDPEALHRDGEIEVITTHAQRQFTGELDLFNDRKILVSGRLGGGGGEVIRVPRARFREMLAAEPDIGDVVLRAFILRRIGLIENAQGGVLLVGERGDGRTLELERFLSRNGHPHQVLHADGDGGAEAAAVLEKHGLTPRDCPVVVCAGDRVLSCPSLKEVACCLGLDAELDPGDVFDVAVIGAGPGGLAAAVYAASEGLRTVVLELVAAGGQAGTSSKIENYLGFPLGLSGGELAARAQAQAEKFGAVMALPRRVERVEALGRPDAEERDAEPPEGSAGVNAGEGAPHFLLHLDHGAPVRARSVVAASGAAYRKLGLDREAEFEGCGLHYAATAVEAALCENEEVAVVGGGNSAGQAAVFLSRRAKHVHVLIRGDSLADSMSDYLLRRIEASRDITLHRKTQIAGLHGEGRLESITWEVDGEAGKVTEDRDIAHVFTMIGATPNSDFARGVAERDEKGFLRTGKDAHAREEDGRSVCTWPLKRDPHIGETSRPGFFAVGDVRADSVKRVASAVGEGSVVIQGLHRYLSAAAGAGA